MYFMRTNVALRKIYYDSNKHSLLLLAINITLYFFNIFINSFLKSPVKILTGMTLK